MNEIEPGALKTAKTAGEYTPSPDLTMQTSIAISLKRIADALQQMEKIAAYAADLEPRNGK